MHGKALRLWIRTMPKMDETLMTEPPPTFFMALMPARVPSMMAVELTAKTSFQSSRMTSSTTVRPLGPDIPALLTTMSRRPHLASASSTASSHAASWVTSWLKKTASGVSSDWSLLPLVASMSLMMTLAPSRTKMREQASPMPDTPPVTMATLSWSLGVVMVFWIGLVV